MKAVAAVALIVGAVVVVGCGYSDPPPKEACAAHGGVNFPGDTQWVSFPSLRVYFRTTCKDGTIVETGGNR